MRGISLVAVVGLVLSFASFVVNSVRTTCAIFPSYSLFLFLRLLGQKRQV